MAVPDGERAFPVASIVRRRNKKKRRRRSHQWLEKKESVRYRGERTTIIIFSTLCLPNFRRPFFPLLFSSKDLSSVCAPLYIKFWLVSTEQETCILLFFFFWAISTTVPPTHPTPTPSRSTSVRGHVMHTGLAAASATNKNSCGSISGMWLI